MNIFEISVWLFVRSAIREGIKIFILVSFSKRHNSNSYARPDNCYYFISQKPIAIHNARRSENLRAIKFDDPFHEYQCIQKYPFKMTSISKVSSFGKQISHAERTCNCFIDGHKFFGSLCKQNEWARRVQLVTQPLETSFVNWNEPFKQL